MIMEGDNNSIFTNDKTCRWGECQHLNGCVKQSRTLVFGNKKLDYIGLWMITIAITSQNQENKTLIIVLSEGLFLFLFFKNLC